MKTDQELKQQHRAARQAHRKSTQNHSITAGNSAVIDCACVIHSNKYDWTYVERLYNMVNRHSEVKVNFHVYTEHDRSVPPHMIKHCLEDWPGVSGPKKSWWYKLHMFNPEHHAGPLLYFDLDCVILRDITWIARLGTDRFWSLRDFKYLQSDVINKVNSSVMWWDTRKFNYVWDKFNQADVHKTVRQYHGDQDFIEATVAYQDRRYLEDRYFQSYRWQVADGGMDFRTKHPKYPGTGSNISGDCAVIVFHGDPKPHNVTDPQIVTLWC
jgi:hypothetical protein